MSNLDKTLVHFHTRLNYAQSILATYGPSYGLAKKDGFNAKKRREKELTLKLHSVF